MSAVINTNTTMTSNLTYKNNLEHLKRFSKCSHLYKKL